MIVINRETLEFICGIILLIIGGGLVWFGAVISFDLDGFFETFFGVIFFLIGLGLCFCGLHLVGIIEVVMI